MNTSSPVLFDQQEHIVTITLNRPDTLNALSRDVVDALVEALTKADGNPDVRCVILTGAGRSFSSGGNLSEIKAMTTTGAMTEAQIKAWYTEGIQKIPKTMNQISVPTIAAVNGHAIGAGCDLTCMCDFRIASANARFAESFVKVGIIPGDGGTWFLPRIIGYDKAREMLLTARTIDAEQALAWGLVREIVAAEDLSGAAQTLATQLSSLPPNALREAKKLLRYSENQTLDECLDKAAAVQAKLQQLEDHHEAIDAIVEKRTPYFKGK